ncbi:MAG: ATP synthase F1 subunit gamma, partial [Deltaproteobacteria bacterium]|nr:ATP synthase F1 subunit gamma [Deltaproteobacteria bacterium]
MNLKQIRKRIGSVKNTQKVTKAMKLVAAAKLRRSQRAAQASREYTDALYDMVLRASQFVGDNPPALMQPRTILTLDLVVFTSDRGLCGGFNENLVKESLRWREEKVRTDHAVHLVVVGRKGREAFRRRAIADVTELPHAVSEGDLTPIGRELAALLEQRYISGESDGALLAYNRFHSVGTQKIIVEPLLPFAEMSNEQSKIDYLYEPSREELLESLLQETLLRKCMQALLDSKASEFAARMRAMDNATKNASEMIELLTLLYNRARQAT